MAARSKRTSKAESTESTESATPVEYGVGDAVGMGVDGKRRGRVVEIATDGRVVVEYTEPAKADNPLSRDVVTRAAVFADTLTLIAKAK